ncbi:MAG: YkgJ family cysteine cluster protein [Candidatus Hodarchaeota archaeon]
MNSLNKCSECGKCCLETEMVLSKKDINLILNMSSVYDRKAEFVIKNEDGNLQLKNVNGRCVFLDPPLKLCKIYDIRPQGCRYYPMIYDIDKKRCIIDDECPRTNLFYQNRREFERICKELKKFVKSKLNFQT